MYQAIHNMIQYSTCLRILKSMVFYFLVICVHIGFIGLDFCFFFMCTWKQNLIFEASWRSSQKKMDQIKMNVVKYSSQDLHHSNCDRTFKFTNVNVLNCPRKIFFFPAAFAGNPQAKNLGFMLDFCHLLFSCLQ